MDTSWVRHCSTLNAPPPPSESKSPPNKRFQCSYCAKSFQRPSSLKQHVLIHTKEQPHRCNVCGKRFSVISNLRRHNKSCLPKHEAQQSSLKRSQSHSDRGGSTDEHDSEEALSSYSASVSRSASSDQIQMPFNPRTSPSSAWNQCLGTQSSPPSLPIPVGSVFNAASSPASSPESGPPARAPLVHSTSSPTAGRQLPYILPGRSASASSIASTNPSTVASTRKSSKRWIPFSLRIFNNSQLLVQLPAHSTSIGVVQSPSPLWRATSSASTSPSSSEDSRQRQIYQDEEAEQQLQDAFIRSVPPQFVFWVRRPLPPVTPGWGGPIPPPTLPPLESLDIGFDFYDEARRRGVTAITNTSACGSQPAAPAASTFASAVAGAAPVWSSLNAPATTRSGTQSQSQTSVSTSAPEQQSSRRSHQEPLDSRLQAPHSQSHSPPQLHYEERDSYFTPFPSPPSGGAGADVTAGGGLSSRRDDLLYHPNGWMGRLPGPAPNNGNPETCPGAGVSVGGGV